MDEKQAVFFLFNIAKEIKLSFEHPILLLTMKDYADCIFNSLVAMRTVLLQKAAAERVMEIINTAHLEWLQAVQDIEDFKKKVRDVPRELIFKAVDYTKECAKNRYKYFQRYADKLLSTMTAEECKLMQTDFEITSDMQKALNTLLEDKQRCIASITDETELYVKVTHEVEELMNWLDKLNDNLVLQFSKVIGLNYPELLTDLTKIMHEIGEEVLAEHDTTTQSIIEEMKNKRKVIGSMVRLTVTDELEVEVSQIQDKIQNLKSRLERLKKEDSLAVTALQHKIAYLEDRLLSLENLKGAWHHLQYKCTDEVQSEECLKCRNFHIFEHLLPAKDRCRLVEQLLYLWKSAICGPPETESIISILSVADIKEVYSDDLGRFTLDRHGRKLYKLDHVDILYQRDNHNKLVEVNDDDKHVYFFDECGRYYINERNEHVYKAHAAASEYIIHGAQMLKIKEVYNATEYHYDHLGRYYINKNEKKIYYDKDSIHKYEQDGLGNLVRILSEDRIYESCPVEPIVIEENKYLQRTVGTALRKCLADVVLHQPADPIKYLANSLEKYRYNIVMKQQLNDTGLRAERELHMHVQDLHDLGSSAPPYIMSGEESTAYSVSTTIL